MGHATHFLERLDRLRLPHVELALSLYRDTKLLLGILELARLPEGAERAALCLDASESGPYLVVTRTGAFVTCLAEGMRPNGLHVVSHRELETIAGKILQLRERLELARKLVGGQGNAMRIVRRIFTSGEALSREEVLGILAFQPMLEMQLLSWYTDLGQLMISSRARYEQRLSRIDPARAVSAREREAVLEYWNNTWAIGHLAVLASPGVREVVEGFREKFPDSPIPLTFHSGKHGIGALALRGAYLTARIGKLILPDCKREYDEAQFDLDYFSALIGLTAVGIRHAPLRAEILKAIRGKALDEAHPLAPALNPVMEKAPEIIELVFGKPELGAARQLERGRKLCLEWTRNLPVGSSWRFEREEDVPEALARAATCHEARAMSGSVEVMIDVLTDLDWAARAEPEDLYLPADFLMATREHREPVRTAIGLLERFRTVYGMRQPERVEVRIAPNERCPCGSGRKYKRCCGLRSEAT